MPLWVISEKKRSEGMELLVSVARLARRQNHAIERHAAQLVQGDQVRAQQTGGDAARPSAFSRSSALAKSTVE